MSALFKMIWSGEAFGLLGMILVLGYVGRFLVPFDRKSARLSARLAGGTFIVYAVFRIFVDKPTGLIAFFAALLSSLLVSLLVMTAAWVVLPPFRFLFKQYQSSTSECGDPVGQPVDETKFDPTRLLDMALHSIPDNWRTYLRRLGLFDPKSRLRKASTNCAEKEQHTPKQAPHPPAHDAQSSQQISLCDELYHKNLQRVHTRISESTYARIRQNYLQQISDPAVVTKRAEMIRALILRSANHHNEQGGLIIEDFDSTADIQQYFSEEIRSIESGAWDQTDKEILLTGVEVEMDVAMARATK